MSTDLTFTLAQFILQQSHSQPQPESRRKSRKRLAAHASLQPAAHSFVCSAAVKLRLTDAPQTRARITTCRQLRRTAASFALLELLSLMSWSCRCCCCGSSEDGGYPGWCLSMLMAGDDSNNDTSGTVTGCVLLFCRSEVDVRLLTEEPRATAVKNKHKKNSAVQ